MASVYVASVGDGPLARLAAVKLLRAGAPDHDYRTRFVDEARVVVRLHHNNIVDVREAGEVDDQLYILMELIEGRDLADVWDRCAAVGRAFPIPIAVHLVREILRGLHYAHTFPGLGLVHRDISPSNILIDWAGAVRLADFGLATSAMKASMTVPGVVFGKVGYMAPEQAVREGLDGRADVYSCGVVLWELITGRPLRDAGTDTQMVADWRASRPSTLSRRVDAALDDIVAQALAHDRDERWPSAMAFMQALSEWLAEHAPETTQETVSEFMLGLFGEARERDHAAYTKLLEFAPRTTEWQRDAGRRATQDIAPPSDVERIAPGTELAQRYRVERTLGQGGMGVVYLAEHIGVGRQLAVKVLTHDWSRHEVVARRFREEARAANAANHPNIVEVYDAGRLDDGRLYMAMEYLTGRSLYEEIVETGPLDAARACRIIGTVAHAIGAAHRVGIVHRDLKPDNVMLVPSEEGERVKVLDFGISASAVRSAAEQRLTRPGHCVGTPEYMAPEQAKGRDATPRFDIYALGVMLYEVLCGSPPFASENMVEVLTRKATEPPPPLHERCPGLPGDLVALCHACLDVQPEQRPQTADEVSARLLSIEGVLASGQPFDTALDAAVSFSGGQPIIAADGVVTGPRTPVSAAVPAARRRRLVIGLSASAAVLLGGVLWWRVLPAREQPSADTGVQTGSIASGEPGEVEDRGPTPPMLPSEAVAEVVNADPADAETPIVDPLVSPADADSESEADPEEDVVEIVDDEPAQTPLVVRKKGGKGSNSAECAKVRADAAAAKAQADHRRAYGLVKSKRCWKRDAKARTRLLVWATFQLGKNDECVAAGQNSSDPSVKKTVTACISKR